MSNPTVQPRENANSNASYGPNGQIPDANVFAFYRKLSYPTTEIYDKLQDATKPDMTPESLAELVTELQMPMENSFRVPMEYVSSNLLQHGWDPKRPATAVTTTLTWRKRSGDALRVITAGWNLLPVFPVDAFYSVSSVSEKVGVTVAVSGGAQHTMGRLLEYYPRSVAVAGAGTASKPAPRDPRTRQPVVKRPPTVDEVTKALYNCGLTALQEDRDRELLSLNPAPGTIGVRVNPKASNGFPNQGRWNNIADREMVLQLASECRAMILEAYQADKRDGVRRWVAEMMKTRPYLVAVQGKCKADCYSITKVMDGKLRFYNVLPRQLMLLMQQVTQLLELHARSVFDDELNHTAQGVGLVRGGADALVASLESQLELNHDDNTDRSYAYLHVGDDSWVVVRFGQRLAMFALDCSAFDLTQHSAITLPVHDMLCDVMSGIPGGAPWAQLWHTFMRSRLTVLSGAATVRMMHGGPSGAPLQSKVNDMLMEILLARLARALMRAEVVDQASISAAVEMQGATMGFTVRLEQYWESDCDDFIGRTVVAALLEKPFLFIGYYFHVVHSEAEGGPVVVPFCDLPRTLAQMRYPSQKWEKDDVEFGMMEAARLAATVANLGIPPDGAKPAYEAMRAEALTLLRRAVEKAGADADKHLSQLGFVNGDPTAAAGAPSMSESSLRGLFDYLDSRRNEDVWGYQPRVGRTTVTESTRQLREEISVALAPAQITPDEVRRMFVPLDEDDSQAMLADDVAVPPLGKKGLLLIRPPNGKAITVVAATAGVRPMTARNFARPPPTSNVLNEELLAAKRIAWAERDAKKKTRGEQGGRSREEATEGNADYQEHKSRGRRRHKHRKN